jgi:primase-polymerase (primpol)-like protein
MTAAFIAPNFARIPAELRQLPRWVTWRAESKGGESKPTKMPYRTDLPNVRASSTDPDTWGTFEQAEAAYLDGDRTGVGLVLDGSGDLAGVDIDGCRDADTGTIAPAALALLERLGAAYVEVSPSGTGLRAFGYAPPLTTGCAGTLDGLKVELYSKGRYLTLTGEPIKAGPLAPLQGFGELAQRIRAGRKVNPETGEIERSAPDETPCRAGAPHPVGGRVP